MTNKPSPWQPMEDAPKGGGAEFVTDPAYVQPPNILLLFEGNIMSVGYWSWYHAEGGRGYEGGEAWVEPISGEQLDQNYKGPIAWMQLPADNSTEDDDLLEDCAQIILKLKDTLGERGSRPSTPSNAVLWDEACSVYERMFKRFSRNEEQAK